MSSVYESALVSTWLVTDAEKEKYEHIFDGLNPVAGKLSGDKVCT